MPSTQDCIEAYLRGPGTQAWEAAVTFARNRMVVAEVLRHLDVASGHLSRGALALDAEGDRLSLLVGSPVLLTAVVDRLLEGRQEINNHLAAQRFDKQSGGRLRRFLEPVVQVLLGEKSSEALLSASPFPAVWPDLAQVLARDLYSRGGAGALPQWHVHNYTLLSGFFLTCRLPDVRLVRIELARSADNANGLRGAYLRLVERIGPDGIRDVLPRASTRTGVVRLVHANLSPLLTAVENCANDIQAGRGVFRATYTGHDPLIPAGAPAVITADLVLAGRRAMFQQYDHTILGHMALAAIEQLLRSWAEHAAVPHHRSGKPLAFNKWVPKIVSAPLLVRLDELFEAKQANIRNRTHHGGLMEAENLRTESARQLLLNPTGTVSTTWNRYSPENISALCLECLEMIDQEAPTGLSASATKWINDFAPSATDLASVNDGNTDLLREESCEWWRQQLRSYVLGICPAGSMYFQNGYVGWLENGFDPVQNLAKLYSFVLVFEAVIRNTLHTLNREILQVSPEGDGMKVYYRMLETCDKGLLCDDNIHALLVPFPAAQHAAIRQYLRIAVEIRDSLAHGAILQFDNEARDAMGHCLAKCVQMLMVSGRTHMIRENAFYRWQARNSAEDHGLEDWLSAQKVIDRWFRQFDIVHDGE